MYQKESPQTIQAMFNDIAKRYDLTNHVMSFSLHKYWNRTLVKSTVEINNPHVYLDLCSGTGDIGFDYLRFCKLNCKAYFIDFSQEMLKIAEQKEKKKVYKHHQITYLEADVQAIPLPSAYADRLTMAYGIRNVQNLEKCFNEAYRLLKPGGIFGILELTRPKNALVRIGHRFYLKKMLPLFGRLLNNNQDAYSYLSQSIDTFTSPDDLEKLLKETGFYKTSKKSLSGGIATILLAYK